VFHLKRNPNYYTWTPSRIKRRKQWKYWIIASVSRCCSWCTAWNRCGPNFTCLVAPSAPVTDKHCLSLEMLLPFGVLLSYSALPCQDTHCLMLHKQKQTISMQSNVREWTHVLLVNTPCSQLHSFCKSGVSSGLATRVTLTRISGGKFGESTSGGGNASDFIFLP
jgi:hypothetical protein